MYYASTDETVGPRSVFGGTIRPRGGRVFVGRHVVGDAVGRAAVLADGLGPGSDYE